MITMVTVTPYMLTVTFSDKHVAHLLFYFLSIIAFWSNWGNCLLTLYFKKLRIWSSSNEVLSQWQSQVEPSSSNLASPDISVRYQLPLLRTIHLYWGGLYNLESISFFGVLFTWRIPVSQHQRTPVLTHGLTCSFQWRRLQKVAPWTGVRHFHQHLLHK